MSRHNPRIYHDMFHLNVKVERKDKSFHHHKSIQGEADNAEAKQIKSLIIKLWLRQTDRYSLVYLIKLILMYHLFIH